MRKMRLLGLMRHGRNRFVNRCLLLFSMASLCLTGYGQPPDIIPESATLLSEYIQKKSVSGSEKAAGEFLANICIEKGLVVQKLVSGEKDYNFAASLYPLSDQLPNIVFLNHIDVVSEGSNVEWKYPPFAGVIAENKVWGRGAIDLKGVAVMQLLAIEKIKKFAGHTRLPYNITLLCVSGEESDNSGIISTVENHFEELNAVVAFGEGGTGVNELSRSNPGQPFYCISVSEKKALWIRLSLGMKTSGHGSVPPHSYANKEMTLALNKLINRSEKINFNETTTSFFKTIGRHEKGLRRLALRHPRFFKPFITRELTRNPLVKSTLANTITITNINTSGLHANQIAQEIEALLDCRLLPETDPQAFIEDIRKTLQNPEIKLTILKETPSAPVSADDIYFRKFRESLEEVYEGSAVLPVMTPAHSDNNFLRQKGVPVYGLTPVLLSREQLLSFHNSNEYITMQQLQDGTKVYEKLLYKLVVN